MASEFGKASLHAMVEMQRVVNETAQIALDEAKERLRKARAEADTAEMVRDMTEKAVREYERNMKLPDMPKGVA